MIFYLLVLTATLVLFSGMIALARVGRRLALKRASIDPAGTWQGIGVVDGAVFALLGLTIALTFNGAVSRYDARRMLVVDEANSIASAYRRLDVLPADRQPALRDAFRRYLDLRRAAYAGFPDLAAVRADLDASERLLEEIWRQTTVASMGVLPPAATVMLAQGLTQVFELAARQRAALLVHPPMIVFAAMFGLTLVASLLAGYAMATANSRDRLRTLCFAAVMALAFYVVVDIEFPRLGLIRIDSADQALDHVRAMMN